MARGGIGVLAEGFPYRQVTVESISSTTAQVVDRYGAHIGLSTLYRRGGGPFPRVGEVWIIDRALGFWTFSALVTKAPPVITESTVGVPALKALLTLLEDAGLLLDHSVTDEDSDYNDDWVNLNPALAIGTPNYWTGTVSFRKIAGGLVLLRGSVTAKKAPAAAPLTPLPSTAFTLPPGYRPGATMTFVGKGTSSTAVSNATVTTAGVVTLTDNITLDGICFLGEN